MANLSVNINKIALIRNSRGGNNPDIIRAAVFIQQFGADGITVHPRPDERHIRYSDIPLLKEVTKNELNIEGNPRESKFIQLVLDHQPAQVTLVPDSNDQLTSDHGWDTIKNQKFLIEMSDLFKKHGIRCSIFVDPDIKMIEGAHECGAERIELYTESYAHHYHKNKEEAIKDYVLAAQKAYELGLGINAGHDLNLDNLAYFNQQIPFLDEVSIGHALVCDALYLGLENTVSMYKRALIK
ncbi:MAG: pyridoxine 5'-phosphate synthase [Bacteroidia bacterium]